MNKLIVGLWNSETQVLDKFKYKTYKVCFYSSMKGRK